MDQENDQENDTLQMKAKCQLNDISNQDDGKTKLNWLSKSKSNRKNSIKLPSILSEKNSSKQKFKYTPWLIRKKGNMYRQGINQMLNDVKGNNLPNYYTNKKLAEQFTPTNYQNSINSILPKVRRYSKCITEQTESYEQNQQSSYTACILKNRNLQNQSNLKRNWSTHVLKALMSLNKQKESTNKQIQSIKELIQGKRSKCRLLSKQGYLLVKKNDVMDKHCNNDAEMIDSKSKSIQRTKNQQNIGPKSSLSNHSNEVELSEMLHCKKFLKSAYEILNIKRVSYHMQINSQIKQQYISFKN